MPKVNLFALVGVEAPAEFDAAPFWEALPAARRSKVPIGATQAGVPVVHDLDGTQLYLHGQRETGKSELLRATALGLMLTHSPSDLNVVLLDGTVNYTFAGLTSAPHVLTSVDRDSLFSSARLQQALRGELNRRASGEQGADLVIVVDGFDYLPQEWLDALWTYAEHGRKLGIHVIAAGSMDAPPWADRVVTLTGPGTATLGGTEFGPAFVSQPHEDTTLVDLAVSRMIGQGMPALEFVKPPLREAPPVPELPAGDAPLVVPIGLIDDPYNGRYEPMTIDLSALDGHVVVIGAHGSGKTTVLQTIVMSLARQHSPAELQVHGVDFAGGGLNALADVPNCRAMVSSADNSLLWHLIHQLGELLTARQKAFREAGVWSAAGYRDHVRTSGMVDDQPGDVVVVIDGWTGTAVYDTLRWQVIDFVNRGPDFGVHVVISANRWSELAPEFHGAFGTRLELTLTDPSTSYVDTTVRHVGPGHGIDSQGRRFVVPAPHRIPSWEHEALPKLRPLPVSVAYASLGEPDERIPLGVGEGEHHTVFAGETQHFFVFGDHESGRSTVLRTYLHGLIASREAKDALFVLVDYRKTNMSAKWGDHLLAYGVQHTQLKDFMVDVLKSLHVRLDGQWSGPQLWLVIDDYDLIPSHDNPLTELVDLIPQSKQIGLHVVVAGKHVHKPNRFLNAFAADETSVLMLSGTGTDTEPLSGLQPASYPPGRGVLSTPTTRTVIQTANLPLS